MTLHLLVDTCVWLDLAKDYRQHPVIAALENLISAAEIKLLVPQIVLEEFERNKEGAADDAERSLQSHFSLVRDAIHRFGDENGKEDALKALNEARHATMLRIGDVNASIDRIDKLLTSFPALPTTDTVKARATDRAMSQRAPCCRSRSSVADATIVEIYADQLPKDEGGGSFHAFVTHNSKDFSQEIGDQRAPHEDLQPLFKNAASTYWISLIDLINDIDEELLANYDLAFDDFSQPRGLSEIVESEKLLCKQVWYNRHMNLRNSIEQREHQVAPEWAYSREPYQPNQTLDTVWKDALIAARRTEEEVGVENLGPWDDFEWGMLNGKLSALRWIMGDEWDMLDT